MKRIARFWIITAALLAVGSMLGCEGVSAVGPVAVSGAKLIVAPTTLSFGNVQIGTTQTQSDTPTSAAPVTPKIAQASAKGTGFASDGGSLFSPTSLRRSTTLT